MFKSLFKIKQGNCYILSVFKSFNCPVIEGLLTIDRRVL